MVPYKNLLAPREILISRNPIILIKEKQDVAHHAFAIPPPPLGFVRRETGTAVPPFLDPSF